MTGAAGGRLARAAAAVAAARTSRRRAAAILCAAALLPAVSGCATVPPPSAPPRDAPGPGAAAGRTATLHLLGFGLHAEPVLPLAAVEAAMPALAAAVAPPGTRYVAFGFGERGYFTAASADSFDALRAALPGPAAIRATPLRDLPTGGGPGGPEVVALRVPEDGPARAAAFVAASLARDPATGGGPVRVVAEPGARGDFFAAARGYSLAYTCNTWAMDVLASADAPVSGRGVVLGRQAVARARAAAASGAGSGGS